MLAITSSGNYEFAVELAMLSKIKPPRIQIWITKIWVGLVFRLSPNHSKTQHLQFQQPLQHRPH